MRIAVVSLAWAGVGGVETVARMVDGELRRLGHEVLWLMSDPPYVRPEFIKLFEGRAIVYRPFPPATGDDLVELALGLRERLEALGPPDVVVALASTNTLIYKVARLALGRPARVPLVGWQHNTTTKATDAGAFAYADAFLAVSRALAEELAARTPNRPVHAVGNPVRGIGGRRIPRAPTPTFLYVGRIVQEKRLDRIVRALAAVARQHDVRLVVYGAGDPRLETELQNMAAAFGVGRRIDWRGWREDPWEEVEAATALLLTSDFEGFAMVLAEALAHGVPVIAADCPTGPGEIVRPGVNGWLFPPADVGALADHLAAVASGRRALPDAEACAASVAHLAPAAVAERIVAALEEEVRRHRLGPA